MNESRKRLACGEGSERWPDVNGSGTEVVAASAPSFYRGVIIKLDRAKGWGVVRSASGRELLFQFSLVTVVGARPGSKMSAMDLLAEGDAVGFDVTRTANGTRITTIKPARSTTAG